MLAGGRPPRRPGLARTSLPRASFPRADDYNRVELSEVTGDAGSNYINASYIDVSENASRLRRSVAGRVHPPRVPVCRSAPPWSGQSLGNVIRNCFKEAHDVTATGKKIAIVREPRYSSHLPSEPGFVRGFSVPTAILRIKTSRPPV